MTGNRFIASENWIHHLKRLFCDPLRVPDDLLPQQPQITSKSTIEDTGTENNGMQEGENQGGLRALVEKFEDYWAGVAMETRVDVLWALCESCLVDIDRFRSSSKDDDDQIYWVFTSFTNVSTHCFNAVEGGSDRMGCRERRVLSIR